jgi:hypothetical protein
LKIEEYKNEILRETLTSKNLLFPAENDVSGKYGYVNRDGKLKISYEYDDAGPFNEFGLARVKNGGSEYLIDVKNNRFDAVDNIGDIQGTSRAIDLTKKRLDEIPSEIFGTTDLGVLILANNRLTSIPANIKELEALEYLDLSDNRLTDLPVEIEELNKLKYLVLKGNNIDDERKLELIDLMDCTIIF